MGAGYLEAHAGVSSLTGAFARVEAGARVRDNLVLFGFAEANVRERVAGIGARLTFGW